MLELMYLSERLPRDPVPDGRELLAVAAPRESIRSVSIISIFELMYVCVCICMYICLYMFVCMYMCVWMYMYVYVCICMYM